MGESPYKTLTNTIKGLKELSDEAYSRLVHCQYTKDKLVNGIGDYVESAITLLEAHMPGILKLEDLTEVKFPVYIETKAWSGWAFVYYFEESGFCFIRDDGEIICLNNKNYNKTWRCWDRVPYREQLKEPIELNTGD